jgi:hypothetical protein
VSARRARFTLVTGIALAALASACSSSSPPATDVDAGGDTALPEVAPDGGCTSSADCGGLECCDGACVDLKTNGDNCGKCGNACFSPGVATSSCEAGSCKIGCAIGRGDCDLLASTGCETFLNADTTNCGACGKICLFANADAKCDAGACGIQACKAGFADCDGDATNGCEVNLDNDPLHCGACTTPCTPKPNVEPSCVARVCLAGPCKTGFADCDADATNGCEVDLFGDASNCGACGRACSSLAFASTVCTGATCAIGACNAGHDDCDHSVWSGCEADLATNVRNCGACGNVCPAVPHGVAGCAADKCGVGACDAGYADCDGDATNGCEVNLANDPLNCAACGNACPAVANGAPVCSGFSCGIGSCVMPFSDCFGGSADGCETNLMSSVDHCGGCATVCPTVAHGTRACTSGACGIGACASGYGDCNKTLADGCEIGFASDVANCGSCGNVCPTPTNAVAGCAANTCTLAACNAGYSNCNGTTADGCERNTSVDAANCGGCGIVCGSGICAASKCQCSKSVLVLADDYTVGADALVTALNAAGYTASKATKPSYLYDGASPALTGFGAVVILSGTGGAAATTDMPVAGQTAIYDFVVTKGNGLVLTEWAALHVANKQWATLQPLVLLQRTGAFTGVVTYTVDSAFATHPLWKGLPASFTLNSSSDVGLTAVAPYVTRVASSPQALDAVAVRDAPTGRVVHLAHAGSYNTTAGWSNTNVLTLMANAVGWSARCQ